MTHKNCLFMYYIKPILCPFKTVTQLIEICFRGSGEKRKSCKQILQAILNTATKRGFPDKNKFTTYFSKNNVKSSKAPQLINKLLSYINADECAYFIRYYKSN